jgi:hypothetical protein
MSIALPASVDERPEPRRLHPGVISRVGGPYPNLASTRRSPRRPVLVDGADVVAPDATSPPPRFRGPFPNLVSRR